MPGLMRDWLCKCIHNMKKFGGRQGLFLSHPSRNLKDKLVSEVNVNMTVQAKNVPAYFGVDILLWGLLEPNNFQRFLS